MVDKWKVCIKGKRCSDSWEIAVVRSDNKHGQKSYGWFNDNDKLLVGTSGGSCSYPVIGYVWDSLVETAHELCRRLNAGEAIEFK